MSFDKVLTIPMRGSGLIMKKLANYEAGYDYINISDVTKGYASARIHCEDRCSY